MAGAGHELRLCDFSWDEVLGAMVVSQEQQEFRKQWFSHS